MKKKNPKTFHTHKEAMAIIKRNIEKSRPVVSAHLKKFLQKIVKEEIHEKARPEAMKILMKAKRSEVAEFLMAYHSDESGVGLCCVSLDFIKDRLVKEKLVGKNFGSNFGNKF